MNSSAFIWSSGLFLMDVAVISLESQQCFYFLRYGASVDWQVPVSAYRPGHRHRDASLLGRATVFRQFRYTPREMERERDRERVRSMEIKEPRWSSWIRARYLHKVSRKNVAHAGKGQDSNCSAVRTESMETRFPCAMCLNQTAPEFPCVHVLEPSLQGFTAFTDSADSQAF